MGHMVREPLFEIMYWYVVTWSNLDEIDKIYNSNEWLKECFLTYPTAGGNVM